MATLQPGDPGYAEVRAEFVATQVEKIKAEQNELNEQAYDAYYEAYNTAIENRQSQEEEKYQTLDNDRSNL